MYSTNDIRLLWLDFFKSKDHFVVEPKSLIPVNDPSLLWINSGVATLKDFFSGKTNPPAKRLTNCQRSIRTNDIENVGVTSRHHTFFEMLGNFSIGDYFRDEAIEFAYEFLTKVLKFDLSKIYITVFEDDRETYNKWIKLGIERKHIIKCDRSRNFWDLGEGPCGPCTEIYYDRGAKFDPKSLGEKLFYEDIENDRFVEIWNIVFSQFNNDGKGNYTELARKNIDTGAGLERLAAILQDVPTNYDTSTFAKIYKLIEKHSPFKYDSEAYFTKDPKQKEINRNFVVLVDHLKANVFAIADGAVPGNKERGSVLRKLIRRALISARKLELSGHYITTIVEGMADVQSSFYPHLLKSKEKIVKILQQEIALFEKTLETGLKLFNDAVNNNDLNGETIFKLVETHGFPLEIILDLAREKNITIDIKGFENLFKKHQEISRGSGEGKKGMSSQNENLINFKDESKFIYDEFTVIGAKVIAIFDKNFNPLDNSSEGVWIIFDKTPFYATSGGQSCDVGIIKYDNATYNIEKVMKGPNHQHLHYATVKGISVGSTVDLVIDKEKRLACTRNHSAEHLLHKALTEVVDKNIKQEGASKTIDKLTFDFQNPTKPSDQEIQMVEDKVNEYIKLNEKVETVFATLDEAKEMGAFAYFEDVYAKISTKLRVVKMGNTSTELCGGTHVSLVGDIEQFLITRCSQKGTNSYRIEAITGKEKIKKYIDSIISHAQEKIKKINNAIEKGDANKTNIIKNNIKEINWKNVKKVEKSMAIIDQLYAKYIKENELEQKLSAVKTIVDSYKKNISKNINLQILNNCDSKAITEALGILTNEYSDTCFVCVNCFDAKTQYYIATQSPNYIASEIISKINDQVGGFGNGKKNFAQGGTNQKDVLPKILETIKKLAL